MKKRRIDYDPYRDVVDHFNRNGIRYVVVGMAGINYYGTSPKEVFATMDYDIFLDPTRNNVEKAAKVLESSGFTLGTSKGALKPEHIREIVRNRQTLIAANVDGIMIELILQVSGFTFSELGRDTATFTVDAIPVRVGRLNKLLLSKKLAGRPKDRQFLKRYGMLLD